MKRRPGGLVIYRGPSLLDGAPIICVATFSSDNVKTGSMIQTWILRSDLHPVEAMETGDDASICGDCPHRAGTCYVNVAFAPNQVWRSYKARRYPMANPSHLNLFAKRRLIRLGAYGDPAAVPFSIWQSITSVSAGWTGYTHAWRTCDPRLKSLCMASCDSEADFFEAQAAGWRTFRIRNAEDPLLAREFACPASAEQGHRLDCAQCLACSGASRHGRGSPAIIVHGKAGIARAFAKLTLNQRTL